MAVIMTNEEAIKELQESHDMMRSYAIDESKSRLMTALKMAIKALEQEPTKEEKALLQKWRDNRGISMEEFEAAMDELQKPKDNRVKTELNGVKTELEQEQKIGLLDKIRAEIIENSIEDYEYHGCGTDELIIETSEVLKVIDKYRQEGWYDR